MFERLRRDKQAKDCGMPLRHTGEDRGPEDPAAGPVSTSAIPAPVLDPTEDSGPIPREPDTSRPLEVDSQVRELRLTRLHKVFWPADQAPAGGEVTKGELSSTTARSRRSRCRT